MGSAPVLTLCIASLAVWRVAHLLAAEDGPFDILSRARGRLGDGAVGALFDCFYCMSVWVAAGAAYLVGRDWTERLWLWPALSAAAIFAERAHAALEARGGAQPAQYIEETPPAGKGEEDGVLR